MARKFAYLLLKRRKEDVWQQHAGWPTRHKLWKFMRHSAAICLPFVEALERRYLPGACTSWPQQVGWPTHRRLCPKWKLTLHRAKLSYLLLKRWKGDVCLMLVPADHSRRVGPHVTGNVQNENLRCIERKWLYLLLKRWKGDICLVLVPTDHSRRVGPHVTGYVQNENLRCIERNYLTFCWSAGKEMSAWCLYQLTTAGGLAHTSQAMSTLRGTQKARRAP